MRYRIDRSVAHETAQLIERGELDRDIFAQPEMLFTGARDVGRVEKMRDRVGVGWVGAKRMHVLHRAFVAGLFGKLAYRGLQRLLARIDRARGKFQ